MQIALRKPKKIIRNNIFRYKANGARNQAYCANYVFQLVKLYFACSTCCYTATIFMELETCASRARLVLQSCNFPAGAGTSRTRLALHSCDCPARADALQSCDFRAAAQSLYFAYYTCTSKLRSSSQSWKLVLHVLYINYSCDFPASAGNLYTSRTRLVLQSCNLQLELETCTSRTGLVLQSRDFLARARTLYFTY